MSDSSGDGSPDRSPRPIGGVGDRAPEQVGRQPTPVPFYDDGISSPAGGGIGTLAPGEGPLPRRVGRYELRAVLGSGGMGVVFLAWDTALGRTVVLKTLRLVRVGAPSTDALARLVREAHIAARLDVDGICPVLDVVEADGLVYVVMPFVPGKALSFVIGEARRSGPSGKGVAQPRDHAPMLRLMHRVAQVVHKAHEAGVIHRDLKPANIMVRPDGTPVILDLGLATTLGGGASSELTQEGDILGTDRYMAPEQVEGRISDIDRRTDVYALGVTLYEAIALRRPFEAATRARVHFLILQGRYRPLRAAARGIPANLDAVCAKAMDARRERRYQTAGELADDLLALIENRPTRARPPAWPARAAYAIRRHPVAASLGLAILLAAVALVVWLQRERAGGSVAYLQAFDRYRDAFDRFEQAGFDPGLLGHGDMELLVSPFRDTADFGSLVRNPFSRETYIQIKKHAQALPRGEGGRSAAEFRPRGPMGIVSTARPAFRFERLRPSDEPFVLRIESVSAPGHAIEIPLAAGATSGLTSVSLPEGTSLTPAQYAWSLVEAGSGVESRPSSGSRATARFAFVVVALADRDAILRSCPSTGRESLDALLRAGGLLARGYIEDGLSELDRMPRDASPADRALASMLRAEAACRLGDEDAFYEHRDHALALAAERK